MKVKAHIQVSRGYGVGIQASQWREELVRATDEYNDEYTDGRWRQNGRDRAVVTVEFEVPDSVFAPPEPPLVVNGTVEG